MKVNAIIEIPMGTKNKYEVDYETGRIKLDRVLFSSVTYPAEYGYIENTISGDSDPLDILVLCTENTFPGCIVSSRVLGYLEVIDRGQKDEKIISVVDTDPRFDHLQKMEDIPDHTKEEIKEFFKTYKRLQNIDVEIGEYHNLEDAIQLIETCKNNFHKKQ